MENDKLTEKIIACAYKVHNTLGAGFLEIVYENAMMIELKKSGLKAEQQNNIPVYYDNELVGDYYADIIVEDEIIIELKAIDFFLKKCYYYTNHSNKWHHYITTAYNIHSEYL